jgi:plasmid stabilization system protein ParE
MSKGIIKPVWDNLAKEDLKEIYKFNEKNFSIDFAKKVRDEILQKVSEIVFLKQWQEDEVLKTPYRRIIVRNYKIVYLIKGENLIYILMVFDTRQDPIKYSLKK